MPRSEFSFEVRIALMHWLFLEQFVDTRVSLSHSLSHSRGEREAGE